MNFTLKHIDLSEIDLHDRRFCLRFFRKPSEFLVRSIRVFGIISPPLVRIPGETYQVLDGFRRLEAARICRIEKVNCMVCEEQIDEWDLALFVLSIFISHGLPHILDQASILGRMSEIFSQNQVIRDILPLLGHPQSPKALARLLPLCRMEETLGKALLEGMINQDMALRLMDLEPEARKQIGSLFLHFGYSQSKQFEILEYLIDISVKENRSLTELLREMGLEENLLKMAGENRVKAGEALRQKIRERRNPILSNLEKTWKCKIKSLHLSPSISLNPPPYFEGGAYRLGFTFKDIKGFQEKMAELKALGEKDAWIELFSR